jgi:hypothetical protein
MVRKKVAVQDLEEAKRYIDVLTEERDELIEDVKAQSKRITALEGAADKPAPTSFNDALDCLMGFLDQEIEDSKPDAARHWSLITLKKGAKQL